MFTANNINTRQSIIIKKKKKKALIQNIKNQNRNNKNIFYNPQMDRAILS